MVSHRVHVEDVAWLDVLPGLRLFRSFRQAIHPAKILLALMLVVLLYLGGNVLDLAWGPRVYPGELDRYMTRSAPDFRGWLQTQADLRRTAAGSDEPTPRVGIFATLLTRELQAFERFVVSATSLQFGVRDFLAGKGLDSGGVLGALGTMILVVPGWLYRAHPWFLAVFLLYAYVLTTIFGGAIARLAALHACRDLRPSPFGAMRFAAERYVWFFLAPLIPLLLALFIGLAMAVAGAALFNFRLLDLIGSFGFGLLLIGGLLISLLLIGLAVAVHLLAPAIAVEGTDAFDANSRAFNYVLGRPWRYLFYTAVFLVYGAVTYLFVGFVLYLTLRVTKTFVGLWAVHDVSPGVGRFDAILPDPQLGTLLYQPDRDSLDPSGIVAAEIVRVWVKLLVGLLAAYAVSYYFCAQTWIYLLLRRAADDAEFDEVHLETLEQATAPDAIPEQAEAAEGP